MELDWFSYPFCISACSKTKRASTEGAGSGPAAFSVGECCRDLPRIKAHASELTNKQSIGAPAARSR